MPRAATFDSSSSVCFVEMVRLAIDFIIFWFLIILFFLFIFFLNIIIYKSRTVEALLASVAICCRLYNN